MYPLMVPPLRERGHDVLLISGLFLEENRARLGLLSLRLSADAQAALLRYSWPGNVRELEHLIGRCALRALARQKEHPRILTLAAEDLGLGEGLAIDAGIGGVSGRGEPAVFGAQSDEAAGAGPGLRAAVDAYERRLVADSLARHGNNLAAAARELQMDRANLSRLAARLGLK